MIRSFITSAWVLCCLVVSASAETWTVAPKGKADFSNIQAAIDAASNGDEILVYPGTYTSTVNPVVNTNGKAVWLHSNDGPEVTIISGENVRTCIEINSGESTNTVIEGFTVSNGSAGNQGDGGGLDCNASSPSISNCVFSNNYAGWGAGAVINNSSAHFSDCVFLNNTAVHDGGGMSLAGGSPVLTNCSFIGNSTEQHYGGGVRTSNSTPSFIDCIFENNHGDRWGGAIMNGGTSVTTITNCTFSGNSCADWLGYDEAGGVYNQPDGGGASSIISNSIFCENTPTHVTGVWTDGGGNTFSDVCLPDCPDISGDGIVDVSEILIVIGYWGSEGSPADLNYDGIVNVSDLLIVIDNWGPCE